MYDAVIISDLHLGSPICQAKQLHAFLHMLREDIPIVRNLILNGDVFDSWDFRRLCHHQWKVLSDLRKMAKRSHVVWVNGNHDGPADIVSHLLGVDVVEQFILESGDKKILVLHGHQFDKFLTDHPILTWIGDLIYWGLQKIDKSFYWAKFAKMSSKTFLRCAQVVQDKATAIAEEKGCNAVCCGHTHYALACPGDISYYNSGCWTELPCTYLTVQDGNINLHHF